MLLPRPCMSHRQIDTYLTHPENCSQEIIITAIGRKKRKTTAFTKILHYRASDVVKPDNEEHFLDFRLIFMSIFRVVNNNNG